MCHFVTFKEDVHVWCFGCLRSIQNIFYLIWKALTRKNRVLQACSKLHVCIFIHKTPIIVHWSQLNATKAVAFLKFLVSVMKWSVVMRFCFKLLSPFCIWSPLVIYYLLIFFGHLSVYTFDDAVECMIRTSQNHMVNHFWQLAPMVIGMSVTMVMIMPLGITAYFLDHCVNSLYDI